MNKEKLAFVVDDDLIYQQFMQGHMKNLGYEVRSFYNGQSCIDQLHQKPDLIILDHQLDEEENGLDVLRKIKEVSPKTPVIYLSAQNDLATAVQALKFGSFDYIEKNTATYVRLRTTVDRIHEWKNAGFFKRLNSSLFRF
jgi:DNA-binding NtrC family response regulator